MIQKKPDTCRGCPLYGAGEGFVPDRLRGADVTICLSTPAPEEVKRGGAGYGGTWTTVVDRYLPILGRAEDEVNVTHAVRCMRMRRAHGELKPVPFSAADTGALMKAAHHCAVHDRAKDEGRLTIALGAVAFERHAGEREEVKGFYDWRGHLLP